MKLLRGVVQARDEVATSPTRRPKLVLKISPDLDSHGLEDIADAVSAVKGIDGVIVTNTTIQRPAHLRNGSCASPYIFLHTLLTLSQQTASNRAASPAHRCNPSLWKPSAVCASACRPKYPSSAVVVSHLG